MITKARVARLMSPGPLGYQAPAAPPEVDPQEAKEILDQGGLLVDVREGWELEQLRVPDSLHLPLMELPARIHELPKDRTLVFLCKSGARSQHAARLLKQAGHEDVLNLAGGIVSWYHARLPTETGPLEEED